MGLIEKLLKRKAVPESKVDSSLDMLDRIKKARGIETGKYLGLMQDPRHIPPPSPTPSTIKDLDQREEKPTDIYTPPMEAVVSEDYFSQTESAGSYAAQHPIEAGINLFFDEFARQAYQLNKVATNPEDNVGLQRPQPNQAEDCITASVHTRHWGLFFFGGQNRVDVYLLPYDADHAFTKAEINTDKIQPHLSFETRAGSVEAEWFLNNQRFTQNHIPDLTKHLLDDLTHADNHLKN